MAHKKNSLMTIAEVAAFLRVHRSTVYRLLQEGGLPAVKVGGQWRFNKASVEEWLGTRDHGARKS